ncbi:hypothetical protein PG997_001678 [Apiospora hydei]|uniref:Uncharacterized protein n=1 Tax=Apiospora hydei TaxID=1337664 RepID=A0ABR1XEM2_9PEZI
MASPPLLWQHALDLRTMEFNEHFPEDTLLPGAREHPRYRRYGAYVIDFAQRFGPFPCRFTDAELLVQGLIIEHEFEMVQMQARQISAGVLYSEFRIAPGQQAQPVADPGAYAAFAAGGGLLELQGIPVMFALISLPHADAEDLAEFRRVAQVVHEASSRFSSTTPSSGWATADGPLLSSPMALQPPATCSLRCCGGCTFLECRVCFRLRPRSRLWTHLLLHLSLRLSLRLAAVRLGLLLGLSLMSRRRRTCLVTS